jgi:hypothetical protein
MATRCLWAAFAPFEFAVMILIGVPLYLVWSVLLYLDALRSLFQRAVTLLMLRFRVGSVRNSANKFSAASPLSDAAARGPGREGFRSWLN